MATTPKAAVSSKESAKKENVKKGDVKKGDVIVQLIADHEKVKKLFKQYEKLAEKEDIEGKADIANQICVELTVHATAEEEIFYTSALAATHDEDLINEANVEHDSAKSLIAQIQALAPTDPMFDAKVTVLGEYIDHHVEEEETEMFPEVRKSKLDLAELDTKLTARKKVLLAQLVDVQGVVNKSALEKMTAKAAAHPH